MRKTQKEGVELCLSLFDTLYKSQIASENKKRDRNDTYSSSWFTPQPKITIINIKTTKSYISLPQRRGLPNLNAKIYKKLFTKR